MDLKTTNMFKRSVFIISLLFKVTTAFITGFPEAESSTFPLVNLTVGPTHDDCARYRNKMNSMHITIALL